MRIKIVLNVKKNKILLEQICVLGKKRKEKEKIPTGLAEVIRDLEADEYTGKKDKGHGPEVPGVSNKDIPVLQANSTGFTGADEKKKGEHKSFPGYKELCRTVSEEETLAMVEKDINRIQPGYYGPSKNNRIPVTAPRKMPRNQKEDELKKRLAEQMKQEFDIIISTMPEDLKRIFICIGKNGVSDLSSLAADIKGEINLSKVRSGIIALEERNLLDEQKLKIQMITRLNVFWLTNYGKNLYRYMTKKNPAVSNVEIIQKKHIALECGYSILEMKKVIERTNYIRNMNATVSCICDCDRPLLPDEGTVEPDITITSGDKTLMHILYETGTSTEPEFIERCSRFAQFSSNLNFIVPGKNEVGIVKTYAEKWLEMAKKNNNFSKPVMVRITTPHVIKTADLCNKDADSLAWDWVKRIDTKKPKQGGGSNDNTTDTRIIPCI